MHSPKRVISALIISAIIGLASFANAEPSRKDIDNALVSGNIAEAEMLVKQVVAAHPDSAKAHFKYAEILAAEGKLANANNELSKAEQIQPGLAFARPEAVKSLQHKLHANNSSASHSSSPLVFWALIAVIAFAVIMVIRALTNRPQAQSNYTVNTPQAPNGYGPQSGYPNQGGYTQGNYGAPQSGGLGSSIMGGLATGAAVGAGVVAGEMLMHKVLDDNHSGTIIPQQNQTSTDNYSDISGNDFVDGDNGSWDNDSSFGDSSSFDSDNSGDWS